MEIKAATNFRRTAHAAKICVFRVACMNLLERIPILPPTIFATYGYHCGSQEF